MTPKHQLSTLIFAWLCFQKNFSFNFLFLQNLHKEAMINWISRVWQNIRPGRSGQVEKYGGQAFFSRRSPPCCNIWITSNFAQQKKNNDYDKDYEIMLRGKADDFSKWNGWKSFLGCQLISREKLWGAKYAASGQTWLFFSSLIWICKGPVTNILPVAHFAWQVIFTCHLPRDKFCQMY